MVIQVTVYFWKLLVVVACISIVIINSVVIRSLDTKLMNARMEIRAALFFPQKFARLVDNFILLSYDI